MWQRFVIVTTIFAIWIVCLVCNVFDGLIKNASWLIILVTFVIAWFSAGITKGVLLTKKTVDLSIKSLKEKKDEKAIRAYSIWILMWIAWYALWLILYTGEM